MSVCLRHPRFSRKKYRLEFFIGGRNRILLPYIGVLIHSLICNLLFQAWGRQFQINILKIMINYINIQEQSFTASVVISVAIPVVL